MQQTDPLLVVSAAKLVVADLQATAVAVAEPVVFVAFAGIGMITPPVCVGIYTSAGVVGEDPGKAFREIPLFTLIGIIYGALMIFFLGRPPGYQTY